MLPPAAGNMATGMRSPRLLLCLLMGSYLSHFRFDLQCWRQACKLIENDVSFQGSGSSRGDSTMCGDK